MTRFRKPDGTSLYFPHSLNRLEKRLLGASCDAVLVLDAGDSGEKRSIDIPEQLLAELQTLIAQQRPPLYGLVLAGGQSQRMGTDKGLLQYHGQPQREVAFNLLQPYCEQTFISCNASQASGIMLPKIEDRFLGLGPMGGILSAFQAAPDAAWLVVATDLPYLNPETLDYLIAHRNSSALATAFRGYQELPEPLLTIWEPRAYPILLQAIGLGMSCPRKVLLSGTVELLQPPVPEALQNVNQPDERAAVLQTLSKPTAAYRLISVL
ncbi:MAG: molybdenum cofactor guanylyltransferase [Sphingobacteriales bacterium]|nr:MAG: molybdenum cofactor guanylyltransferase [Sphingobacteriales bacterium]